MKLKNLALFVLVFSLLTFVSFSIAIAEEIDPSSVETVVEEVTELEQPIIEEETTPEEEIVEENLQPLALEITDIVEDTVTVIATKVVCDSENDLPNWAKAEIPLITSTTATDFVANHPNCEIVPWTFEWAPNGTNNPGDQVGVAGGDWTPFSGSVDLSPADRIWVREQANPDYIPFYGITDNPFPTPAPVSAEFYCNNNIYYYDNYEWIDNTVAGETYHCIAFNVLAPSCGVHEMDIYSDVSNIVDGNNAVETWNENPAWTASIPGAKWIWDTLYVQNPTQDETRTFSKTFNVTGEVTSATLYIAADNSYKVSINSNTDVFVDSNAYNFTAETQDSYDVMSYLVNGSNTISFEVKNHALENGTEYNNPAGLLYKLHVVTDDCGGGENLPPVADAGTDQTITLPTNSTTLIGSASYDTDGSIVSYAWIQVSGPSVVDPANVMNYDIFNLVAGTYVFQLIVVDNDGAFSTADTVTITVNEDGGDGNPVCSDGLDNDGDGFIDFPEDEGCESADDNSEDNRRIIGGGGIINRGQVLGAQSGICDFAIDTYMRRGYNNDKEEVKILQALLNKYVGSELVIDGFYGPKTEKAVNDFQVKYRDTVLDPWNIDGPTGIFFRTSLVQAQNLECPDLGLPVPENLINWSQSAGEVPNPLPVPIPLSYNYFFGI